jgi:nanoRNase/pAp phosphatase (c-di-AMP/oligoRNAs hydrolase)
MSNTTIAKHARENHQFFDIAGNDVPGVNCSKELASDACAYLCDMYQNAPFAVAYVREADGWRFLLISPGRTDVSVVAAKFGGSGDGRAAEFVVKGGPHAPLVV